MQRKLLNLSSETANLFLLLMKYELVIETETCTNISNHIHNRDGYKDAFKRLNKARDKKNFKWGKIISERDGVVFECGTLAAAAISFFEAVKQFQR